MAILSACAGGSGSSGFDINAATEPAVIQRVLDDRDCLVRRGLTICPAAESGDSTPTAPTPSMTPSPGQAPRIDTQIDSTTALTCTPQTSDASCRLTVRFTTAGFAPDTIFVVAARGNEDGAPWSLYDTSEAAPGDRVALVRVPLQGLEAQLAILVFATTPANLPDEVNELADSGAASAYVTQVLMLSPV